jgi:hypothetical protein
MLETIGKGKLDLIKWMDTTKTRTDNNTSWNLTESSGTVTMKIESLSVVGLISHEEDFSVFQFHGIRIVEVYVW